MPSPPRSRPRRTWAACELGWIEVLLAEFTQDGRPAPPALACLDARAWWVVNGDVLPVAVALRRWAWPDDHKGRWRARWLLSHPRKWAESADVEHLEELLETREMPQRAPKRPRTGRKRPSEASP